MRTSRLAIACLLVVVVLAGCSAEKPAQPDTEPPAVQESSPDEVFAEGFEDGTTDQWPEVPDMAPQDEESQDPAEGGSEESEPDGGD